MYAIAAVAEGVIYDVVNGLSFWGLHFPFSFHVGVLKDEVSFLFHALGKLSSSL